MTLIKKIKRKLSMAKTSMIARENKRARTVAKFAEKRAALRSILKDINASEEKSGRRR